MVVRIALARQTPERLRARMARSTATPGRVGDRRMSASILRLPYRPSGVILGRVVAVRAYDSGPAHVPDGVCDLRVGVGSLGDLPTLLFPQPVGACRDLQALAAQDPADRLDGVTLGSHLVDEGGDEGVR